MSGLLTGRYAVTFCENKHGPHGIKRHDSEFQHTARLELKTPAKTLKIYLVLSRQELLKVETNSLLQLCAKTSVAVATVLVNAKLK